MLCPSRLPGALMPWVLAEPQCSDELSEWCSLGCSGTLKRVRQEWHQEQPVPQARENPHPWWALGWKMGWPCFDIPDSGPLSTVASDSCPCWALGGKMGRPCADIPCSGHVDTASSDSCPWWAPQGGLEEAWLDSQHFDCESGCSCGIVVEERSSHSC